MTLRLLACLIGSALVSACALLHQKSEEPIAPAPEAKPVGVMQQLRGDGSTFVVCADCPQRTPKTLPRATMPVVFRAPVPTSAAPAAALPARTVSVVLPFDNDSAMLGAAASARLDAIKPVLRRATSVRIVTYTDNIGSGAANAKLADRRALQVMLAVRPLLPSGLPSSAVSATGRPLCCYVAANNGTAGRAANRRAEITITLEAGDDARQDLALLTQPALRRLPTRAAGEEATRDQPSAAEGDVP